MTLCKNPSRPSICLCPINHRGYGPRQVLAQKFINGWLSERHVRDANALATDDTVPEKKLWQMLFELEDFATDSYEMWKSTQ